MADLKLRRADTVPASLDHRALLLVGTDPFTLYIGDADNLPVVLKQEVSGSIIAIDSTQSPYSVTLSGHRTYVFADATNGATTINLPTAASAEGRILTAKKVDSSVNNVTVTPNGTETIDGAASQSLSAQYEVITIISDGLTWHIL